MAIIRGTSGNDVLTGTPLADSIFGYAGDDLLLGLAGNDTLDGGIGNDTLDGGLGIDSLIGGSGNDTYIVDNVGDIVVEAANAGIDTVQSSVNFTLASNVENLTISGAPVLEGRGNELNNVMRAILSFSSYSAEGYSYTLRGGAGNDTLYGAQGDWTSEVTNYLYGDTGDDELFGGDLATNIIYGGVGNDTLYGAIYGQDQLYGGPGDDTYFIGHKGSTTVYEEPNSGIDTVFSGYSYTLGDGLENLVLGTGYYSYAQVGTGNALNNKITGNAIGNVLQGLAGNDTLSGEAGDDHLLGTNRGVGEKDVLIGKAGRDTFYLGNANTVFYDDGNSNTAGLKDYALIKDFNPRQDFIKLHGRRSNYFLAPSPAGLPAGTAIYLDKPSTQKDELIAIVQGSSGLNINGKYFRFTSAELNPSNLNGKNGFTLTGASTREVSNAGDINGDGFDDLIIGSSRGSSNYVVFGKASNFNSSLDLTKLNGTNGFKINGIPVRSGGSSNTSVSSAGDINGDGIADIIIGAPYANPNDRYNAGSSYVVFGKTGDFNANFNLANLNGSNGFAINGISAGDRSGSSVSSAGDINGDGFDDLIIGAPDITTYDQYQNRRIPGAAYVVFGKASGFPANINLSSLNGNNGFAIHNAQYSYRLGSSVSGAGDINNDGYDDIIIGQGSSSSYVLFGSPTGFTSTFDTSSLNGRNGFEIVGLEAQDDVKISNAGDINGDGFDDIIIGNPIRSYNFYDPGTRTGKSYVVFGSASGFAPSIDVSTLNGTNGFTINGINAYDNSGISVSSAGDINGDGFEDLLVGASSINSNGMFHAGESYVIFGKAGGFGTNFNLSEIDGTNGLIVTGKNTGASLGSSVSSAGDLNGDGFDDLIVAASNESYVIFGRDFTSKVNRLGTPGDDLLIGTNGNDILIGGLGNDTLRGGRGSDVLYGGAGDDILIFGPQNRRMDGGSGTDTLAIEVSNMTMDLMAIPYNRITGIEIIDLTGTGNNSLKLTRLNVLNLSDTTNQLIVKGNAGDSVTSIQQGWLFGGTTTLNSNLYDRYTSGAATLLVDTDITQTIS